MPRVPAKKRLRACLSVLEKRFGKRERYGTHPPVKQALVTLLLKKGKEGPAERAISRLARDFVDLNEARVCRGERLDAVLGGGYPPGLGQLVSDTLTAIFNHSQAMNLDRLLELPPQRAETTLKRMKPMPSRVAGELLLTQLGYGRLPEAAGIRRVASRLKLIRPSNNNGATRSLRRLIPATMVARAFHAFETLAERICTARAFDCRACPISDLCPTGAEMLKKLRAEEAKERAAREAEDKRQREKRDRERRTRARKRAATARLKKAIQVRSKKLKISPSKKRKRRPRAASPPKNARMVQASSAEVKPDRRKSKRPRRRAARPKLAASSKR